MPIFGIFLVRIFPHLDWIRRDTEYPSVISTNAGKWVPEKLWIRAPFTHCRRLHFFMRTSIISQRLNTLIFWRFSVSKSSYFVLWNTLSEKCPYSEFFWAVYSHIQPEYGEVWCSSNVVQSISNVGKYGPKSSDYKHFLRSDILTW